VSTQPQILEVPRRPAPDLIERIGNALPEAVRMDYYREIAHCRELPDNDEMLRVIRAMQFLALLIEQAPAQVAAEREKLELILSEAVHTIETTHQANLAHQRRIEAKLTVLPEQIVGGIDASGIAYQLSGALEQRLNESGIPKTAATLAAASQQMNHVAGEFQKSSRQLLDAEARVAESARENFERMQQYLEQSAKGSAVAAQQLARMFSSGYRWSVLMIAVVAMVVGFLLGFLVHDSAARGAAPAPQAAATEEKPVSAPQAPQRKLASPNGRRLAGSQP
jgi:hypothetical protein